MKTVSTPSKYFGTLVGSQLGYNRNSVLEKTILPDENVNGPLPKRIQDYWSYFCGWDDLLQQTRLVPSIVPTTTNIGIEIELEKLRTKFVGDGIPPGWEVITDNSLRNSGYEFVSQVLRPEDTNLAVLSLYHFFNNRLANVPDTSWRTSVHVHLNVRELTGEQLHNLILLYSIFELALFRFVGASREHSNFCVPITRAGLSRSIGHFRENYGNSPINDLFYGWSKYSALNVRRLSDYGTLEFRHMHGLTDPLRLLQWTNLLVCLYNAAERMPSTFIMEQLKVLNTKSNYDELRKQIFTQGTDVLLPTCDLIRQFSAGVAFAKQTLAGNVLDSVNLKANPTGLGRYMDDVHKQSEELWKKQKEKDKNAQKQDDFIPEFVEPRAIGTRPIIEINWNNVIRPNTAGFGFEVAPQEQIIGEQRAADVQADARTGAMTLEQWQEVNRMERERQARERLLNTAIPRRPRVR